MREVIVAKSAGFCFGVRKAVETVYREAENAEGPVYTYGPIIHNETVVEDLRKKGVQVIEGREELERVRCGTVIIRSHGVGREIYELCEKQGLRVVDATCPFVTRIHDIVRRECAEGKRVVIVGDPGHPEVQGIRGWGNDRTLVIESAEDLERYHVGKDEIISLVAQTTYHSGKFKEIVEKSSELGYDIHCFNTICNATQERQTEAGEIASGVDAMVVIGGRNSSNTRKLVEICSAVCGNTFFIQTSEDLNPKTLTRFERIGITAGASTPQIIIEEVQIIVRSEL